MAQIVLIIHLVLALALIATVLLQRSEGGALGIGGGGGGFMSARGAATALQKATWGLAIAFIATSLTLTVLAARDRGASAVIGAEEAPGPAPAGLGFTPQLPPVPEGGDAPLAPPPVE